jgi:hypothetical protein
VGYNFSYCRALDLHIPAIAVKYLGACFLAAMWKIFPVALLLVAGCASPGPSDSTQDADLPTITDPRDTAYLANATPGSHVHDYWQGRNEIQVISTSGSLWSACYGACDSGMSAAHERPEEGVIVPQGTKWVNGTFNFTAHAENTATTFELWVKTAEDSRAKLVGPLTPGVPFSIESTQDKNDPPHYVLSLWQVEVVGKSGAEDVVFRGDYQWEITAIRGLPLVPYPPHPDRWEGRKELNLLEERREALLYYETPSSYVCYGGVAGCPGRHHLPDSVVVPFDTDRVEVRVTSTVPTFGLRFHGADTWKFQRVQSQMSGLDQLFVIPVTGAAGDSPYAKQSLWEFWLDLDQPQPNLEAWTGTYTISVKAFKK